MSLIRRGEGVVVQVLLYSKLLKRVIGAIDIKEQTLWPQEQEGHIDS